MKIMIVRHCDPDYQLDSLTERGFRERDALTDYLKTVDLRKIYVSPMGRARATVAPTEEAKGMTAEVCDWLREFALFVPPEQWDPVHMKRPTPGAYYPWDHLPSVWLSDERVFGRESWREVPGYSAPVILEAYDNVCARLDEALAENGYVRDGLTYRVESGNMDTIAFFCHFGVESVLLSHLMNISPVSLWQMTLARPSSVTELITEEREKGIAVFRMMEYGDTSHLYGAGLEPSPAGLYRERYENDWQR